MNAVVICNGEILDYSFYKKYYDDADLVICADGGAAHAKRLGIRPDVLLGDFDSISEADYEYFQESGVRIIRYRAQKDMTDTELALEYALENGCSSVTIIGGLGSRADHSLSNVLLLKKLLDRGVKGTIVNERNEITLIRDRIALQREENVKVSLLQLSETVEGVTTKGLMYPLDNARMELGTTWGVSNEFTADTAEVSIRNGLLLVIKSRD